MKGIVLALVLHNQMCPQCFKGEPCPDTERLHDKWLEQVASATLSSEGTDGIAVAA